MLVRLVRSICVALLIMALPTGGVVAASEGIGTAEKVVLDVRSLMPHGERRLVVNSDVFQNEVVETKDRSATRLVFRDETYLSMGPNSKVRIANLPVAEDPDRPFVVEATSGVFKFVSGRLRSDQYRIETPTATIGVRGTIVWISVSGTRLTQVASQTGEVFVCAKEDCVTLVAGEATKVESDKAPTPPGLVPDDFYALIRDMTARLMIDGIDGITAAIDAAEFQGVYKAAKSSRGARSRRASATGPGISGFRRPGFRRFGALSLSRGRPGVQSVLPKSSDDSSNELSETDEEGDPPTGPDTLVEKSVLQDDGDPDNGEPPPDDTTESGAGVWPEETGQPVAIPVPATAVMLLVALGVLGFFRWCTARAGPAPVRFRRE